MFSFFRRSVRPTFITVRYGIDRQYGKKFSGRGTVGERKNIYIFLDILEFISFCSIVCSIDSIQKVLTWDTVIDTHEKRVTMETSKTKVKNKGYLSKKGLSSVFFIVPFLRK